MSFKITLQKVAFQAKKHSPAIFTGIGVVGLGATAYLAYKSRDKVEAVVENLEEQRELGIEVNKVELAKDLTEALYQPVVVGAASVACILFAQKIQNDRIKTLIGVVAVEQARNIYFENKYKKEHGEEAFVKFSTPTEEIEVVELDKKGKEKLTVQEVKKEIDLTIGQWYSDSSEYVADDHAYNIQMIDSVNERLQTLLFQRGSLMLNEVREALGFERIRNGALLGWTTSDYFEIEKTVANVGNVDLGEAREQIWVSWSRPRYVYDEVEFNGRYSIY